jgi:RNA polymerase sigma-70 factor, ECF subfamily
MLVKFFSGVEVSIQLENASDRELIGNVIEGDKAAFEILVARHYGKVYALCLRLTRDSHDAEEVVQDTFVTVYKKAHTYSGASAFSSWLYRVTANCAFMAMRKSRRHKHASIDEMQSSGAQSEARYDAASIAMFSSFCESRTQLRGVIHEAISELPEQYRAVYVLRDVDLLSSEQVGAELNLSVAAVKSRLHRSRELMRKRLKSHWSEYKAA